MVPMARRVSWSALAASGLIATALLQLSCCKAQRTGYLLDIHTGPPQDQIPKQISVRCLKPGGFCIKDYAYPDSGQHLAYLKDNRLALIAIDVDADFDKPRRLWVRARRDFDTLAEYAMPLPPAVEGQQVKIDVFMPWGKRADKDGDGVPDSIDGCPNEADPDQDQPCANDRADAGSGDATSAATGDESPGKVDAATAKNAVIELDAGRG